MPRLSLAATPTMAPVPQVPASDTATLAPTRPCRPSHTEPQSAFPIAPPEPPRAPPLRACSTRHFAGGRAPAKCS
jgi:hypothetical protein